jgi:hypothetical protein
MGISPPCGTVVLEMMEVRSARNGVLLNERKAARAFELILS